MEGLSQKEHTPLVDGTLASSGPSPATVAPHLERTLSGWPVNKLQGTELRKKLLEAKSCPLGRD